MDVRNPISALDELATRYERRAGIVRQIATFVGEDAALATEVVAALTDGAGSNGQQDLFSQPQQQTHFSRIKAYFERNGNSWRSVPDMMKALQLKRGGVSHVVYRTHADAFERRRHPQKQKMVLWRLRKEVGQ